MRVLTPTSLFKQPFKQPAAFEKRALDYDTATPIQTQVAQALAKRIVTADFPLDKFRQQPTTLWLDIGCGTGKLSKAVITEMGKIYEQHQGAISSHSSPFLPPTANTTYQLWGVDSSTNMLACYENKLNAVLANAEIFNKPIDENSEITNAKHIVLKFTVKTCCADMQAMPFLSQSAGLVMSSFALHWASPLIMTSLLNLLSPKGQLHMAIPVTGSFSHVAAEFSELPIFPFLPEQVWLSALTDSLPPDSKLLYAESQSYCHGYTNLRALLKDLKQMGGTVSFDKAMDSKVLRHYLQSSTPVILDYQVLMVGVQR